MSKQRILVVDDNKDFIELVKPCIEGAGREVECFTDSLELLKALECPADLLITDLLMPWLDGITLVKGAYLLYPRMGVLVVSGYSRCERTMKELGFNTRYLKKPFNLEEFQATVQEMLEQVEHLAKETRVTMESPR